MWITILEFLKTINDHYANLILLIIAIVSAIVAYREYSSRHRPYVVPEIVFEKQNTNWYFYVMLVNKGEFPATARVAQAVLRIGDEEYPTVFRSEILLCSGEKQKLAPVGHINKDGRNKILGHEYRNLIYRGRAKKAYYTSTRALYEHLLTRYKLKANIVNV